VEFIVHAEKEVIADGYDETGDKCSTETTQDTQPRGARGCDRCGESLKERGRARHEEAAAAEDAHCPCEQPFKGGMDSGTDPGRQIVAKKEQFPAEPEEQTHECSGEQGWTDRHRLTSCNFRRGTIEEHPGSRSNRHSPWPPQ
jgi:hypothetical protein